MVVPIVDTHIHYWEPPRADRPHDPHGIDPGGPPVSVEAVLATTTRAGVDHVIQIAPAIMGYDNRYALEGAARFPDAVRVFARVNPASPNIAAELAVWAAHPIVHGVRCSIMPPNQGALFDGSLAPFFRAAQDLGLPVAVFAPNQPAALGEIAARHPEAVLLVDHLALHSLGRGASFARWGDILALERHPNAYLKVSYFPEATAEEYPFPRAQEYMREVYERFSPDRLIWGSNYPPLLRACSYEEALDFMRGACDFISDADREQILGGNAIRVLSLPWGREVSAPATRGGV